MSNPTELPDLNRQFRKKPVVIEAIQWTGKLACLDAFNIHELHQSLGSDKVGIPTLEGIMIASVGDWIIKGVKGEFYPCKPDIFAATYEPAARRAKPEGEAPQAVAQVYLDMDNWMDVAIGELPTWERKGYTTRTLYPAATFSPLCGAQHAEIGASDLDAFGAWKSYPLPDLNSDGHFDKDWLHREFVAFKAGRRAAIAAQQAAAPADCSGTPSSCPDNEGYGCHCSAPGTPEAPKKLAHGQRDDYFLMANARRIANYPISSIRRMQNWALAMELFATGSHSAHQICIHAGIDPDSYKVERAAQLDGGQEGSAT